MYEYQAKFVRAVDGDTVYLEVDLGFCMKATLDFRLKGLNAPEMHGGTKTAGLASKIELERLLGLGALRIVTEKTDKYGRWLVSIDVLAADGSVLLNVNQTMINGGFAVPFMV